MILIHILAGATGLASGAVSMAARKGSPLHRRAGQVFTAAMLTMSSTGAVLAALRPERGSVVVGLLTFYLVATALLTVRLPVERMRGVTTLLMLWAAGTGAWTLQIGANALAANGRIDSLPAQPIIAFGVVALIAAALDLRMLMAGRIDGRHRLARHLWRMMMAMWIATSSFFFGQAGMFPKAVRQTGLLALPILIVTLCFAWWLLRTLWVRRKPVAREGTQPA